MIKPKQFLIIAISISSLLLFAFVLKNKSFLAINSGISTPAFADAKISLEDQIWDNINQIRLSASQDNREKALTELAQTLSLIDAVTNQNLKHRLLIVLVQEYLNLGEFAQAIELTNNEKYQSNLIDYNNSVQTVGNLKITQAYLKNDQFDQALDFANNLEETYKYTALTEIIKAYGEKDNFTQAQELLLTFPTDSYDQYSPTVALIEIYAKKNQYEEALIFIDSLKQQGEFSEENIESISSRLIELTIEAKEFTIAEKTINQIRNQELKVANLRNLIDSLMGEKQVEQVKELLNQTFSLAQKTEYFSQYDWAKYFLFVGEENKVKTMISQISQEEYQGAYERNTLAMAYLENGYLQEAFSLAKLIPPRILLPLDDYPDPKDELLENIFTKALEINNIALAKIVIPEMGKKENQVRYWQNLATYFEEKNQPQLALENLDQALTIAKTIDSISVVPERSLFWTEPNVNLLINLAKDYHKLDKKEQALKILEMAIKSTENFDNQITFDMYVWRKSQAFMSIAQTYLDLGETEKVTPLLEKAETETLSLLADGAENRFIIEDFTGLMKFYEQINQPKKSLEFFNKIVELTKGINITDNMWNINTYFDTIKLAIDLKQNNQAIDLINLILPIIETTDDPQQKTNFYTMISHIYLRLNKLQEAENYALKSWSFIQQIEEEYLLNISLETFGVGLVTDNSLKLALKILPYLETRAQKVKFLMAIASYYNSQENIQMRGQTVNEVRKILPLIYDLEFKQQIETQIKEFT